MDDPQCGQSMPWNRITFFLLLGLGICGVWRGTPVSAQVPTACYHTRVSNQLTVGATAVRVAEKQTSRCAVTIMAVDANGARCAPGTGPYAKVVSSTVGVPVDTSRIPTFDKEMEAIDCIRAGGSDATVIVVETYP